jgi:hypothetical protein
MNLVDYFYGPDKRKDGLTKRLATLNKVMESSELGAREARPILKQEAQELRLQAAMKRALSKGPMKGIR